MFFFFNDTATTEIYTLSLHDALPISCHVAAARPRCVGGATRSSSDSAATVNIALPTPPAARSARNTGKLVARDRKSTRLNSSHANISYAVFCLKKKKTTGKK